MAPWVSRGWPTRCVPCSCRVLAADPNSRGSGVNTCRALPDCGEGAQHELQAVNGTIAQFLAYQHHVAIRFVLGSLFCGALKVPTGWHGLTKWMVTSMRCSSLTVRSVQVHSLNACIMIAPTPECIMLQSYLAGDRFLAMFDDAEERPAIADQEAGSPSSEQDTPSTSESESGEDEAPQRWTGAADKVLPTPRQPQVKAAPQRPFVEDRERYKAERRAFMSGRIGGPRNTPQPGTQRRKPGAESAVDPRSRAEFAQIQRDVLDLGGWTVARWRAGTCRLGPEILSFLCCMALPSGRAAVFVGKSRGSWGTHGARGPPHVPWLPNPRSMAFSCLWQVLCLASPCGPSCTATKVRDHSTAGSRSGAAACIPCGIWTGELPTPAPTSWLPPVLVTSSSASTQLEL